MWEIDLWGSYKRNSKVTKGAFEQLLFPEIKKDNEQILSILKEKINSPTLNSKVIPVLGAGVSADLGLPNWQQLLNTLFIEQCEKIGMNNFTVVPKTMNKQLTSGDNMQKYINLIDVLKYQIPSERKSRGKSISDAITPPFCGDFLEYGEYFFQLANPIDVDEIQNKNFYEMVKKAVNRYHSKTFSPESLLKSPKALFYIAGIIKSSKVNVITYNFDNLLEAYLVGIEHNFKTINNGKEMYDNWNPFFSPDNRFSYIYHVHGCIRMNGLDEDKYGKESDHIIFSETEYHDKERYAYEWVHAVQAERLHRKDLMVVGFSTQDHNFRRILQNIEGLSKADQIPVERLGKNTPAHFIFIPIEDILKTISLPKNDPSGNPLTTAEKNYYLRALCAVHMMSKKLYLQKYRFYPIWTSYDMLPEMLKGLLNKESVNWLHEKIKATNKNSSRSS